MRASKTAVLNVQCQNAVVAECVKSTFASLVKRTITPDFIGNVSFLVFIFKFTIYIFVGFLSLFGSLFRGYVSPHLCHVLGIITISPLYYLSLIISSVLLLLFQSPTLIASGRV